MQWINVFLVAVLLAVCYVLWVRPILKKQPSLRAFYSVEGSFWAAMKLKLTGVKQKLLTATSVIAIVVVQTYDQVLPALTGVDATKLTSLVPDWAWPILTIAGILLMNWFRELADDRHQEEMKTVASDATVTMTAATTLVSQASGLAPADAMDAIVDKKAEIAPDVTQTQPM